MNNQKYKTYKYILEGGIFFKCNECGSSGIIIHSDFTLNIKHIHGIPFDAPLGIVFTKCDQHG